MKRNAMKKLVNKNLVILIGLIIVATVLNTGCLDPDDDDRIGVVVTILPQKEFVERVGGDNVKVTVMVPPGQSPHTYEPTPGQMKEVARAELYFKVGSGVEFETVWMDTLKEQNSDMEIVDGHEGITLIPMGGGDHDNENTDPHIWLSPKNVIIMVQNLLEGLKKVDPDNADYYTNNTNDYIAELDTLDVDIETGLEPYQGNKFLVYHPAFGYLAHDYGLIQIAIEEEGKEPTAKGLQAIIDQAKEEGIRVVFVSPQFDKDSAESIAEGIDGSVVFIDPLGDNYIENIRDVTMKLIKGFSKE